LATAAPLAQDQSAVLSCLAVFGGCFDPEFEVESRQFFDEVRAGRFTLVISELTLAELQPAPEQVRGAPDGFPPGWR